MSVKRTKIPSREERLQRLREMKDEDIDYSDIPATDEAFWADAVVVRPDKRSITMRLDEDVYEWLKVTYPQYQTAINSILRQYKEHQEKQAT